MGGTASIHPTNRIVSVGSHQNSLAPHRRSQPRGHRCRPSRLMPPSQLFLNWRGSHKALTHQNKHYLTTPSQSSAPSSFLSTPAPHNNHNPSSSSVFQTDKEEFHPSSSTCTFINLHRQHTPKGRGGIPILASVAGRFYPHGPLGSCRHQKSPKNSSARSASVDNARWRRDPS